MRAAHSVSGKRRYKLPTSAALSTQIQGRRRATRRGSLEWPSAASSAMMSGNGRYVRSELLQILARELKDLKQLRSTRIAVTVGCTWYNERERHSAGGGDVVA